MAWPRERLPAPAACPARSRRDNLYILLGHLLADVVMVDGAAVAIKNAAQIIEGAGKGQSGHVDVPMRMG